MNKWISIEERLPDFGKEIEVTDYIPNVRFNISSGSLEKDDELIPGYWIKSDFVSVVTYWREKSYSPLVSMSHPIFPKALQRVLCTVKRGDKTTREICVYTPPRTVLADDFIDDDWAGDESCTEYDEENDCYWTREGWWETSYEADMSYKITGEVIDWMEIP